MADRPSPGRTEPIRTCVGCRRSAGKTELIRVVRRPDGAVALDGSGRQAGRGAYVHPVPSCIDRAGKGSLARALRAPLAGEEAARLVRQLHELAKERG